MIKKDIKETIGILKNTNNWVIAIPWIILSLKCWKLIWTFALITIIFSNIYVLVLCIFKDKIEIKVSNSLDLKNILYLFQANSCLILKSMTKRNYSLTEFLCFYLWRTLLVLVFSYSLRVLILPIEFLNLFSQLWGESNMGAKKLKISIYKEFMTRFLQVFIRKKILSVTFFLPIEFEVKIRLTKGVVKIIEIALRNKKKD